MSHPATEGPRDWWVIVGMAVAAISAAVASFAGLRGLAQVAGWPDRLAWLLPVTIDAYAMTSARVWLAGTLGSERARGFARANAIGAIATSIVGNAGRAVAVDLLAATQRPTQKAMGGGALRSQMSVRVCLRVRERRDVDLILDKGMLAAGWHAHTLDAPGKFYVLADGHNQPRRARAYLVTDVHVRETAARYADQRPELDPLSQAAVDHQPRAIERPPSGTDDPEQALLTALSTASDDGLTIPELIDATGMGRTWIYGRLQALATAGHVRQVTRGRWHA